MNTNLRTLTFPKDSEKAASANLTRKINNHDSPLSIRRKPCYLRSVINNKLFFSKAQSRIIAIAYHQISSCLPLFVQL